MGYLLHRNKLASLDLSLVSGLGRKSCILITFTVFGSCNFYFLITLLKLSVVAYVYTPVMLILERLRQEAYKFEANLATWRGFISKTTAKPSSILTKNVHLYELGVVAHV